MTALGFARVLIAVGGGGRAAAVHGGVRARLALGPLPQKWRPASWWPGLQSAGRARAHRRRLLARTTAAGPGYVGERVRRAGPSAKVLALRTCWSVFSNDPEPSVRRCWLLGSAVLMTLCLLVVGLLVARWRHAGLSECAASVRCSAPARANAAVRVRVRRHERGRADHARVTRVRRDDVAFLAGLLRADFSQARGVRSLVARLADLPAPGDLRDALAGALGDATERGVLGPRAVALRRRRRRAVELPAADDPDRAVTEIERDGRRIAAIVHDRALVEDQETVRAAGAATALLLENQRLDAELRARMEDLRASRQRLVQAGDAERRRLERDLHDGAQSRLVALALNLRLARGRLDGAPDVAALLDESIDELKLSLEELRELAHGIHPAVLSDRGLEPALRALAARAPVPVALEGSLGGRLPAAVETAAYFVVSEGLTNVAKYAQAAHARVRMQRVDGRLLLEVSDDGIGGAAPSAGSGLHGLSDRVAALDGEIEVASPPGGGTRLRVELPCA